MPDNDPQMDNNKHHNIKAQSKVAQKDNNLVEITKDMLDNANINTR